ncbi:TetR/AcrR family transcriptional regulator [Streptomyces sp. 2A115]|uniref:TetR/AcrR family transcriptional regulator n=1 Tax=Streptomyces sp. 2A115 TaxID=3457439 RepID=UPI003FD4EF87
MTDRLPLRLRKQQQARDRIVAAAFALFTERGFAEVTVTEIAERADVGRTTFFRYFGDKQEVVFADEQHLLEELTARLAAIPEGAATSLPTALEQVRTLVLALCAEGVGDPARYVAHGQLLEHYPELFDRNTRKLHRYTKVIEEGLVSRGAPGPTAVLAAQLGLACYHAGSRLAGSNARALVPEVAAAFDALAER